MAASSSMTRMRDLAIGSLGGSAIFDADGLQLPLAEIRHVDIQRQHIADDGGADDAAHVGHRRDRLAVDLEEYRAALEAAVERGAQRLDARDRDAFHPAWQGAALGAGAIELL